MSGRRALHFVFKIGNRNASINFYRKVLGMKVLRHEEFEKGCEAACNGPYDGKWSKTMIGYGAEDDHFVIELTYNYGIKSYKHGNDFQGFTINSPQAFENMKRCNRRATFSDDDSCVTVKDPEGYTFVINNKPAVAHDPVEKISLTVADLAKSVEYWSELLDIDVTDKSDSSATLTYDNSQSSLHLVQSTSPIDRAEAFGRVAFSCPSDQLRDIEQKVTAQNHTVLTPYISLDTPGKATVQVVILADPDGHEICFVGDEGFRELSKVDPTADQLLNKAMEEDKSEEWFAEKAARQAANKS